jgi:hypothetical protein
VPRDKELQRLSGIALPGQLVLFLDGQLRIPGRRHGVRRSLPAIAYVGSPGQGATSFNEMTGGGQQPGEQECRPDMIYGQ